LRQLQVYPTIVPAYCLLRGNKLKGGSRMLNDEAEILVKKLTPTVIETELQLVPLSPLRWQAPLFAQQFIEN